MTSGNGAVCSLGATSSSEYFSVMTARGDGMCTDATYTCEKWIYIIE